MSPTPVHKPFFKAGDKAHLEVTVKTPGGRPIQGASVEVVGLRGGCKQNGEDHPNRTNTNAQGKVTWRNLELFKGEKEYRTWHVKVAKEDHGPPKAAESWHAGEVQVEVEPRQVGKLYAVEVVLTPLACDLTVQVRDPKGRPVAGASVEVWGLRGGWAPKGQSPRIDTDGKGQVVFRDLPLTRQGQVLKEYVVKIRKEEYGRLDGEGDEQKWSEAEITKKVPVPACGEAVTADLTLAPKLGASLARVTHIVGKVRDLPGLLDSNGVRKSDNPDPSKLHNGGYLGHIPAELAKTGQADFVPYVFVAGTPIDFSLEGNSDYLPAEWSVAAGPYDSAVPSLQVTHAGNRAKVHGTEPGIFRVTARLYDSEIHWFGCYVRVSAQGRTSTPGTIRTVRTAFSDADRSKHPNARLKVKSGGYYYESGKYAGPPCWRADVNVSLRGGTLDPAKPGAFGLDCVQVGFLQTGVGSDLVVHYEKGRTKWEAMTVSPVLDVAGWAPKGWSGPSVKAQVPGKSSVTSVLYNCDPDAFGIDTQKASSRTMWMVDSPGPNAQLVSSPYLYKDEDGDKAAMLRWSGGYHFRTAVAAFSVDAKNMIILVAECRWSAVFAGTYEVAWYQSNEEGEFVPDSPCAGVTASSFSRPNGWPTDAASAGYATKLPIWIKGGIQFGSNPPKDE